MTRCAFTRLKRSILRWIHQKQIRLRLAALLDDFGKTDGFHTLRIAPLRAFGL